METKTITIKKKFQNDKKDGSGHWWNIVDTDDTRFSVWDALLEPRLPEGATVTITYKTNDKGYHTVQGIAPDTMGSSPTPDEAMALFTSPSEPNKVNPSKTFSVVDMPTSPKEFARAYSLLAATNLVASKIVSHKDLMTTVSKFELYILGEDVTEQKSSSTSELDEFNKFIQSED